LLLGEEEGAVDLDVEHADTSRARLVERPAV
jgi:hypothetical protein